ncbi:MAG: tetratricopeptide repeat protein, partial [Candidatus Eisenbacteria bacterium]
PGADEATPARADALVRAGAFAIYQADYEAARPRIEESLALYRHLHYEKGIARALSGLAVVTTYLGDNAVARACYEESLARYEALGQKRGQANVLHNLGLLASGEGRPTEAIAHFEAALALLGTLGDRQHMALTLAAIAGAEVKLGNIVGAHAKLTLCLALALEVGAERETLHGIEGTIELAARCGRPGEAAWLLAASAAMRQRLGSPPDPTESAMRRALEVEISTALGELAYSEICLAGAAADPGKVVESTRQVLSALDLNPN